ncbi:hypothetical protein F4Z99_07435 [Candidatus Poribacteria bacterium]|nr:hypothetical protein [Candidatus Poribacteria bacterium]
MPFTKYRIRRVPSNLARHGKIAPLGAYGMMDVEAEKPMTPDTIFRSVWRERFLLHQLLH